MARWCVHVVRDSTDDRANTQFVQGLADLHAGRLVCEITPGTRSVQRLAHAVLRGLGKRTDAGGRSLSSSEAWAQAMGWAVGEQVSEIFVSRAQLLDAFRLQHLIELAAILDAQVWLIFNHHRARRKVRELLAQWPTDELEFAGFASRWADIGPSHRSDESESPPPPCVPEDEFPTFLASCRRLLPASDYAVVEATFFQVRAHVARWFAKGADSVDPLRLVRLLRALVDGCIWLDEAIVRLRAAQVAAFHADWAIKVDLSVLHGAFALPLSPPSRTTTKLLRIYPSTRYSASALIALVSRASPSAIGSMSLADLSPHADRITVANHDYEVPPHAVGILCSHMAFRSLEGAVRAEPLFLAEKRRRGGRRGRKFDRITSNGLRRQLLLVSRETGLSVVPNEQPDDDHERWLRRRGITIAPLHASVPCV